MRALQHGTLQETLRAAEEGAAAAKQASAEALNAAQAEGAAAEAAARDAGAAEAERLRKLLAAAANEKAELEAKVARAAGALKAADDLRDAKCAPCPCPHRHAEQAPESRKSAASDGYKPISPWPHHWRG